MREHQVLIVGGGPVGLTLAIDLGQQGIECLLIDKRPEPSFLPKMERCHPRTMEHFRRLGVADAVRGVGLPSDVPFAAFLVRTLAEPELARIQRPSVIDARAQSLALNNGRSPAEPAQVVSQYALEPLLKSVAERTPGVTVQFGCELISLQQKADSVVALVRDQDGRERTITALYVAGCDGASSEVRSQLGFRLEGKPDIGQQIQALFQCDDLFERIQMGKGVHYYRADDCWTFLITQGDTHHFSLHAMIDDERDMPALFETLVGMPIKYKTLYVGKWTMRLMLSDRYASKRVFLAGDSAHLVTPIGGMGMNTGVGDAIDLAWKLAATLKGWGGEGLLASYEIERRPIGDRVVKANERGYLARRVWRDMCETEADAVIESNDPQARERVGQVWLTEHAKSIDTAGLVMGYRYLKSPIVCYDAGDDGADQASYAYTPSMLPGGRIPHLWLKDGSALQDHIKGYTLVTTASGANGAEDMRAAFRAIRCPLAMLDVSDTPETAEVYRYRYVLLRPDLHIAWRGNEMPDDPAALAAQVTGRP